MRDWPKFVWVAMAGIPPSLASTILLMTHGGANADGFWTVVTGLLMFAGVSCGVVGVMGFVDYVNKLGGGE